MSNGHFMAYGYFGTSGKRDPQDFPLRLDILSFFRLARVFEHLLLPNGTEEILYFV